MGSTQAPFADGKEKKCSGPVTPIRFRSPQSTPAPIEGKLASPSLPGRTIDSRSADLGRGISIRTSTRSLPGAPRRSSRSSSSQELAQLAITRLGVEVQRRGMEWLHLPVPDVSTPGPEFEAGWPAVSNHLRSRLDAGENILIHCRGGVGRSGMIAARLLVESGADAEEAIARVRAARPGAIETWEQVQWAKWGPRRRVR